VAQAQRTGPACGIDHYVVPTADVKRWITFYADVLGAEPRTAADRPGTQFTFVGRSHVGGSPSRNPLTPGTGLPRYSWFIRPEEIARHLERLDANGVSHTPPTRTAEEGEEGTAIRFPDPDGNQLEFWAPARMPEGVMEGASSAGVGLINAAVFESRNLDRSTDFYGRYCGLDTLHNADVAQDTVVLPLAGWGRLVFKRVDRLGVRTTGHAVYRALHTAMVIGDEQFMPAMDRMWRELPEWDFDPEAMPRLSAEEAGALPARTCIHGSPIGPRWKSTLGRGDSFCDWDTNVFHFVGGTPVNGSMVSFKGVEQERYLEGRGPWMPDA
jgi:catechol 2,3-dioxygenase-like lactoylglutathione lyase family enzyme